MLLESLCNQRESSNSTGENSERLFELIYAELYQLARARLRHESAGHTLQPTALVHEVYLRLVSPDTQRQWDGAAHFFSAAARAMRQILIDSARRKYAQKRLPPGRRIDLSCGGEGFAFNDEELLELHAALNELEKTEPVKAQLVEMKFFAGMEIEQICSVLGISRATAHRYWTSARAWLFLRLN
ncbi:MAG: sigma-70 family RNA polymerase sigma factor [Planctomycetales bacterium]|nr:sigma-70 family RNA polymerase sigma factor [Planctomycetales bacterium]